MKKIWLILCIAVLLLVGCKKQPDDYFYGYNKEYSKSDIKRFYGEALQEVKTKTDSEIRSSLKYNINIENINGYITYYFDQNNKLKSIEFIPSDKNITEKERNLIINDYIKESFGKCDNKEKLKYEDMKRHRFTWNTEDGTLTVSEPPLEEYIFYIGYVFE